IIADPKESTREKAGLFLNSSLYSVSIIGFYASIMDMARQVEVNVRDTTAYFNIYRYTFPPAGPTPKAWSDLSLGGFSPAGHYLERIPKAKSSKHSRITDSYGARLTRRSFDFHLSTPKFDTQPPVPYYTNSMT